MDDFARIGSDLDGDLTDLARSGRLRVMRSLLFAGLLGGCSGGALNGSAPGCALTMSEPALGTFVAEQTADSNCLSVANADGLEVQFVGGKNGEIYIDAYAIGNGGEIAEHGTEGNQFSFGDRGIKCGQWHGTLTFDGVAFSFDATCESTGVHIAGTLSL